MVKLVSSAFHGGDDLHMTGRISMAMMIGIPLLVLLLTTVLDGRVSAFILDSQLSCIAYPPCSCSGSMVHCNNKNLASLPKFFPSNLTDSNTYFLYMSANNFTTILADSFINLTVSNNTIMYLQLSGCQINSIAPNGFRGLRDAKLNIDLSQNYLTSIPLELTTLTDIGRLNIRGNPIVSLNPNTMYQIGNSIESIYIDLYNFKGFPTELNLLKSLESLDITGLNSTTLDYDIFDAFASSLTSLSIIGSKLEKVPVAICHLHNLLTLTFELHRNVHINSQLFEPCSRQLTSLYEVDLSSNNLRYMPDVFSRFPRLTYLILKNNKLSFIHWDSVPSNSSLYLLHLSNNDFTRIPSVLGKLHSLTTLHLAGNEIKSVEDGDLSNLHQLHYIYLEGNPIEYISPYAFNNNLQLAEIHLENTDLGHLPISLAGLSLLQLLHLDGSPLECDCDLLFMQSLDIKHIDISGTCKSMGTIHFKTFLMHDLQRCN